MEKFQTIIWEFYRKNKREFPWRNTSNPYFIFLSEVMLQQTQTARVVEKYLQFTASFPTVESLANATFPEVLRLWIGLGYNRRAKYLHESAKLLARESQFPNDPHVLDDLPGIGYNTAAAICVYSFNKPLIFIETNIRRVFIHHFFKDQDKVEDKEILVLVEKTLPKQNPREWYWALMDYGAALPKTVENPNRKSASYMKQSPFKGSRREVRASILKLLVNGKHTRQYLKDNIVGKKSYLDEALTQLVKEGLVLQKGSRYSLQ